MSGLPPVLYGTLREHYVILFGAAGAISIAVGSISAWIGARLGSRRLLRELRDAQLIAGNENAARFQELKQSLEEIALEVERVSEGQRFTARVLAERSGERSLPRHAPGEVTPH